MRWPPWRRDEAGSGAVPTRAAPRPVEAGWAYLPPLQRTIATAAPRITAPHDLVAWRSPALTGRMSHAVSTAAPGGVVDGDGLGLAAAAPLTREPLLDMPLLAPPAPAAGALPALPRALVVPPAAQRPSLTVSRAVEVPLPVARQVADPVAPAVAPAPPDPGAAVADPVAAAADDGPSAFIETSGAEPADRPALFSDPGTASVFAQGMVLHDNGGATEVVLPRPLPASATPLAPGGRAVAATGTARPPGPGPAPVQREVVAGPGTPQRPGVADAAAPGTVGPPRRLGLGAPLPSMPVVQRAASDPAAGDGGAPGAGPVPGRAATARPEPPAAVRDVAMPVPRDPQLAAPIAAPATPPQARGADVPAPREEPAGAASVPAPVEGQAPLLPDRAPAAAPDVPVQRADAAPAAPPPLSGPPLPFAAPPTPAADGRAPEAAATDGVPSSEEPVVASTVPRSVDLLGARPLPLRVAPNAPAPGASRTAVPVQRVTLLAPVAPAPAPPPHALHRTAVAPSPGPTAAGPSRPANAPAGAGPGPAVRAAGTTPTGLIPPAAHAPGAPRRDAVPVPSGAAQPWPPAPTALMSLSRMPSASPASSLPLQRRTDAAGTVPGMPSRAVASLPAPPAVVPSPASLAALPAEQLRLAVAYRPQLAVDQQGTAGGNVAAEVAVQREADVATAADAAADSTQADVTTTAGDRAATTGAAASTPASTPAGPATPTSPEELDKLAARLVEPLTRRIKAEMIIDRERRGLRSDPR